ncbi:hypothetical protein GCM10011609_51400 [Lentzea pudingi]|uniref:Uncharacterized protein n=1 Tax=Lentzea pudingi TaxID=1789439 RepID=A0ABQ2IB05_9PSEU|nr:hypothetical protein GCM10011609_51400 [Lentzea pudingi]
MPSTYGRRGPPDQIAGGLGAEPSGEARNRKLAARKVTTHQAANRKATTRSIRVKHQPEPSSEP